MGRAGCRSPRIVFSTWRIGVRIRRFPSRLILPVRLPLKAQVMGIEKRQREVPAEQGAFAADGVPDQQAVEGISVIRGVGTIMLIRPETEG